MAVMRILIAFPTSSTPGGNSKTANSWARALTLLGHEVHLSTHPGSPPADLLIAMHAEKSHEALIRFRAANPKAPIVLALTGTDLYPELSETSLTSLQLADRLVVLQEKALHRLPSRFQEQTRVIYCVAPTPAIPSGRYENTGGFTVCVVGHLRAVKDPLRTARASRLLPPQSAIRVLHAGAILDNEFHGEVDREQSENTRYQWLGQLSAQEARELIASSDLLSHTSSQEGGGSVLAEALMSETPIVASRNDATTSLLGDDYPGLFSFGNTETLAALLSSCESPPAFRESLLARAAPHRWKCSETRALECWRPLLEELFPKRSSS